MIMQIDVFKNVRIDALDDEIGRAVRTESQMSNLPRRHVLFDNRQTIIAILSKHPIVLFFKVHPVKGE